MSKKMFYCQGCDKPIHAPQGDDGVVCECGIIYFELDDELGAYFGLRDDNEDYITFIEGDDVMEG